MNVFAKVKQGYAAAGFLLILLVFCVGLTACHKTREQRIPLDSLEPYRATDVKYPVPKYPDYDGGFGSMLTYGDIQVGFYQGKNGDYFAAYKSANGYEYVLINMFDASEDNVWPITESKTDTFKELFGQTGFRIDYAEGKEKKTWYDYFYVLDKKGVPDLLVNTTNAQISDLNRDGPSELVAFDGEGNNPSIFFWRDGKVNKADVIGLVTAASPDWHDISAENNVYDDAASGKSYILLSYTVGKNEEKTAVYFDTDALFLRPAP